MPIPFYPEMKMHLPRLRALRDRLHGDDIDVIHLTTPGPAGLAARWLSDSLGLPLVGSYHTGLADYTTLLSGSRALGRLMATYMRWLYGACELVMVPSAVTRERLIERGWRREQLSIWSRGVDCEQFSPSRRSEALRRQWGISDPELVILYGGRLSREKGLGILRRIQHVLAAHGVMHRFVLAGDGPMTAELREVLPDAVFTGCVPHSEMGRIMASADLFLFPSATDTAGNVILEAQASGLPVLVTDKGGPQEDLVPLRDRLRLPG